MADLRDFPKDARQEAGYQLHRVQDGEEPAHWKPIATVGAGAGEIKIKDDGDEFRVIYVAKFEGAVYVLHCFQKKTQKTPKKDIEIAAKRYRDLVEELKA